MGCICLQYEYSHSTLLRHNLQKVLFWANHWHKAEYGTGKKKKKDWRLTLPRLHFKHNTIYTFPPLLLLHWMLPADVGVPHSEHTPSGKTFTMTTSASSGYWEQTNQYHSELNTVFLVSAWIFATYKRKRKVPVVIKNKNRNKCWLCG